MTNQHPITPPPELVDQWVTEACPECRLTYDEFTGESVQSLATIAARWGADQELEEYWRWMRDEGYRETAQLLHSARRPKPPTLKEQALALLEVEHGLNVEDLDILRRALEALPND